jgi:hypothetical protein
MNFSFLLIQSCKANYTFNCTIYYSRWIKTHMHQAQAPTSPNFSYDALNTHFNTNGTWLENNDYMVAIIPSNKQFIAFFKKEEPKGECPEGIIFKNHGLKFHISLPEYNGEMYRKGWDIVRDTLMSHQVASFKIVRSEFKMSDSPGQEGKDVTVYVDIEPGRTLSSWKNVLQDVTNNLVIAGITPGYRTPGTLEKPEAGVNGSNYITYRYYNEKTRQSVWPNPDPCQNIHVTTQNQQPDIPKLGTALPSSVDKSTLTK